MGPPYVREGVQRARNVGSQGGQVISPFRWGIKSWNWVASSISLEDLLVF